MNPGTSSVFETMLTQMQQMSGSAASSAVATPINAASGGGIPSFSQALKGAIDRVSGMQDNARAMNQAFELGVPGVSLNDAVIESQKAGVAFEMVVQSRNRLISAYQDIMNMSV